MLLQRGIAVALVSFAVFMNASGRQETVEKVKVETLVVTTKIPSETLYQFDRGVAAGRVKKAQAGREGQINKTYEILKDQAGKEISRRLVETENVSPLATVYLMGREGYSSSRGSYTRSSVRTMEATAYLPSAGLKHPTYRTATGLRAQYGVIAVDPRVIKLGTKVFVEGYGFAIAADTGGAIKGNIIDVCLPTDSQVRNWGRRHVKVHVFKERS